MCNGSLGSVIKNRWTSTARRQFQSESPHRSATDRTGSRGSSSSHGSRERELGLQTNRRRATQSRIYHLLKHRVEHSEAARHPAGTHAKAEPVLEHIPKMPLGSLRGTRPGRNHSLAQRTGERRKSSRFFLKAERFAVAQLLRTTK